MRHIPAIIKAPSPALPNTRRWLLGTVGRPLKRTAKAAARFIHNPDQANAPKASDPRCQPANRTPAVKAELTAPAPAANQGRQRPGETKSKPRANAVPTVACPLG